MVMSEKDELNGPVAEPTVSTVGSTIDSTGAADLKAALCSKGILLYTALITWMVIIFLFSAEPNSAEVTRGYFHAFNFAVRKLAHFSEYAILAILAIASLGSHVPSSQPAISQDRRFAFNAAVALSVFYSMTDEIHQAFVPGRSAAISDVLVDSAGVVCGAILVKYLWRRKQAKAASSG